MILIIYSFFHLSRSHAVLEITVKRKQKGQYGNQVLRGKLALVDLAGRLYELYFIASLINTCGKKQVVNCKCNVTFCEQ
jgi:hypothetical protein